LWVLNSRLAVGNHCAAGYQARRLSPAKTIAGPGAADCQPASSRPDHAAP